MSRTYNARITRSPVSDRNKSNNRQLDTQIILKNCLPFGYMTGTDQIKISLLLFHESGTILNITSFCHKSKQWLTKFEMNLIFLDRYIISINWYQIGTWYKIVNIIIQKQVTNNSAAYACE